MNDRQKLAEDAARAMGWTFERDPGWVYGWATPQKSGSPLVKAPRPDLDSWAFKGAMIEWLGGREVASLESCLIGPNPGSLEPIRDWGQMLAEAVIFEAAEYA